MLIRGRVSDDLPACAAILARTHQLDGYPRYARNTGEAFLSSPVQLGAWVAEIDGRVLGHVALHGSAGDPCFAPAHEATGLDADELAVVARLVVDPDARRLGVGAQLLAAAVAAADASGRRAILDVTTDALATMRFYERAGWRRLGLTTIPIPDEDPLDVYVYLSPEPTGSRPIGRP